MNFSVSKNYVYREQFLFVDYGEYQEYVLLKCSRLSGYDEIEEKKGIRKASAEEVERIESARCKSKITELALCNHFEFFFTQTINSNFDRYDLDEFKSIILKKFKAYKRKNEKFIYLVIFEKHKDGAFHLHGLVGGLGNDLHLNDNGFYSLGFFEDIGFNSLSKIKDKIAISHYITKYMSKGIVKTSRGCSYFHSHNLKFAKRTVLDFRDYKDKLELTFENEFCKKYIAQNNPLD